MSWNEDQSLPRDSIHLTSGLNCTLIMISLWILWILPVALAMLVPPIIRIEPEQPVYLVGESIILRCLAENMIAISSYHFYKDGAETLMSEDKSRNVISLTLTKNDMGLYFCAYKRDNSAYSSTTLKINIFDYPDAPTLSVVPERPIYFIGQSVSLSCLFQRQPEVQGIHLYQDGYEVQGADNFGVLNLKNIGEKDAGNYTCVYRISKFGRIVNSQPSEMRTLKVTQSLPSPNLKFYPNAIQSEGTPVRLICESPSASIINGYRFYKDGKELKDSKNPVGRVFTIAHYNYEFEGCYFCQTYKREFGIEILSPESPEKFLTARVTGGSGCHIQDDVINTSLSYSGILLYGSILAGKLLVLISLLLIFGIHIIQIRKRNPS